MKPATDAGVVAAAAPTSHPDTAPQPPGAASVVLPTQGVDPGSQQPKSWPAPPQSPPAVGSSGTDPGRVEEEPPAGEPSRQWVEVVIPAETVIGLEIDSTISTESARVEDDVEARVTRDVRVEGRVAIPAGTRLLGSVTLVERGGPVKTKARLGFRFHTLMFADRTRVAIATDTVYRVGESPGHKSSAKIGGAAIGGAIIGAILGGGRGAAIGGGIGAAGGAAAAMQGERLPVVVPAGTTLSVRTQEAFILAIEK